MPNLQEWRERLQKRTKEVPASEIISTSEHIHLDNQIEEWEDKEAERQTLVAKFKLNQHYKPTLAPETPPVLLSKPASTLPEEYTPTHEDAFAYVDHRVTTLKDKNTFFVDMVKKKKVYGKYTVPQLRAIGRAMKREPIAEIRDRLVLISRFNAILHHLNDEVFPNIGVNNKKRQWMNELLGVIKDCETHGNRITEKQFFFAMYRIHQLCPEFLQGIDTSKTRGIPSR